MLFDARSIPLETARSASALLQGMQANDVRRAAPGAGALFEWALGVVRLREQRGFEPADHQIVPLKPKEADLSPLPKLASSSSRFRLSMKNGPRRCRIAGFDRSRSAALMGMTLL